jgi:hypothetical protein
MVCGQDLDVEAAISPMAIGLAIPQDVGLAAEHIGSVFDGLEAPIDGWGAYGWDGFVASHFERDFESEATIHQAADIAGDIACLEEVALAVFAMDWPACDERIEDDSEGGGFFFILFAFEEHFFEADFLWWAGWHIAGMPLHLICDHLGVLFSGVFDSRADHFPPHLEPGFGWCSVTFFLAAARVTEEEGIKRLEDFAAVVVCPRDWVGVLEGSVFGIDAVDAESRNKRSRAHIAARPDIVSGEYNYCVGGDCLVLGDAEHAVGVELGRERFFDRGTTRLWYRA